MKLRDYQEEHVEAAVAALKEHGGFALFNEQRTGKTPTAAEVVARILPRRLLVTCPEIAIPIWEEHLAQIGTNSFDYQIITRDSIWSQRKKLRRWIAKDDDGMVVADEGHDYKGKDSKRSRALRIIGHQARYRLLLTGTPQESGLEDYWAQMDFIDPTLFGEWKHFKARFLIYGGFRNKKIVDYRNEAEFRSILARRSVRVLLEEVKPQKTDIAPPHVVRFDLSESRSKYDEMEQKFILELNKRVKVRELAPDGSVRFVWRKKRVAAPRAITQAMKLHQISGGFIIDDDKLVHRLGDEKLTQAGALMLAIGESTPQVWFARFVPEIRRLGRLFTVLGRSVTYIAGRKSMKLIAPEQAPYVSGSPFDIALVQIQSGVSIDLSYSEEAAFFSWTYSYLTYDQAKFRIRSYHGVRARYHFLVARNTVDEQLLQVALDKQSFAKLILDKFRR